MDARTRRGADTDRDDLGAYRSPGALAELCERGARFSVRVLMRSNGSLVAARRIASTFHAGWRQTHRQGHSP